MAKAKAITKSVPAKKAQTKLIKKEPKADPKKADKKAPAVKGVK